MFHVNRQVSIKTRFSPDSGVLFRKQLNLIANSTRLSGNDISSFIDSRLTNSKKRRIGCTVLGIQLTKEWI